MLKVRNVNASPRRLLIPGAAVLSLIAGAFYYRADSKSQIAFFDAEKVGKKAERIKATRDEEGLSGAGIGGNFMSGGHEKGMPGSGMQMATDDEEHKVQTTAKSRDELPSGGVGGGVGGGGANTRSSIDSQPKGTKDSYGNTESGLFAGSPAPSPDPNNRSDSTTSDPLWSRAGGNEDSNIQYPDTDTIMKSSSYSSRNSNKSNTFSASNGKSANNHTQTEGTSASQRLQSMFGQGGKSAGEPGENQKKFHDNRFHSVDADTPTKRIQMRSSS